ncbi:hypothetical protein STRIP9103_00663, partial [Streptomyces ipomoeae 91-03]
MLAIASLATGFVVAAITPSHGLDAADTLGQPDGLSKLDVDGTLGKVGKVGKTVAGDGLALGDDALGGKGQKGKSGKEG